MNKKRNLYLGTILSACAIACTGCFNNNEDNGPKEYEFQYLIDDSKVMETSDIGEQSKGKTHLYVRAWDSVRPTPNADGKRGMQPGAEYIFDNLVKVFNPDTKLLSTDIMVKTETVDCVDVLRNELDGFFKDNGENDINYVSLGSHGDPSGGLAIFDDGVTGVDSYSHVIHFNTIVDWLSAYKGRFYIFLSACFSGRWLDPNFGISKDFMTKLDSFGDKFTIITEASTSNLYTPYVYGNSDTTAVITSGLVTDENGKMPADYNNDGNVTVQEMFIYGRVNWTAKGTDCHLYAPNRENEVFVSNRSVELYSTTSGYFGEEGKEKLVVNIPNNKVINSIGMPTAKEGYKFTGWSYDSKGKNIVKFPLNLKENVKLFANYDREEEKPAGYINAKQYDVVRIPYKDGSYNDFIILDFKTNDDKEGMYLVSKDIAGMTSFPAEGQTSSYYFEGTQAQAWCKEYANRLFPDKLFDVISPSNASFGTTASHKLNNEKVFFLNKTEVNSYFTSNERKLKDNYYLLSDGEQKNLYVNTNGSVLYTSSKAVTDVYGARPAMNLNISKADLAYEPETNTFYIRDVGRYIKKTQKHYNGTYQVKTNGSVTYTAEGKRKNVCDNMNTFATTYWETQTGFTYPYSSEDRYCYKAGGYRGLVYNELNRDFYDCDNISDCIDGIEINGVDSSAAISAAYSLAFDKKFTAQDMTCPGALYDVKNFSADAVTSGTGKLRDYKDVGKVKHLDYVSVVGNPTIPTVDNNDTKEFLDLLAADLQSHSKTIQDEVFSKILPGDMLVSRFTNSSSENISHARLVTGVELVKNGTGKIDPAQSKIIFADAVSPNVGRYIYGGQYSSFLTSDIYSKNGTNTMTFNDLLTTGYIPVTLNNWTTGY